MPSSKSAPPFPPQSQRDRRQVMLGMAAVSLVAWTWMLRDAVSMQGGDMADMGMPPTGGGAWGWGDFTGVFVMWTVMMVAMMTPAATPMAVMFASVNRQRQARGQPFVPTALFIAGYLAAWTLFSALLTLAQWPLHHYALLTPMMDNNSRWLAGGVLLGAGIYQWTPWKDACLAHCRTPLGFLLTRWRDGYPGAFGMGLQHGGYCLGCCWALMIVMFAVGVMSMLWAALIALLVLVEKVAPMHPGTLRRLTGLALGIWGMGILAGLMGVSE